MTYAGQPQFKPIPGTDLIYAVNTSFQVIGSGGKYYVCYQGAWFVGPTPNGPWALADSIPQAIHTIPPSSPVYNVSYVNVYAATPETVTYGYTAGYAMGFITAGALVYGTGYYYPPYVVPGVMPVYYPYPYSYAGAVWYNPATATWARGGTVYGPYGGVARAGAAYNPATRAPGHAVALSMALTAALGRGPITIRARAHTRAAVRCGDRMAEPHTRISITRVTVFRAARHRMPMPIPAGDRARSARRLGR